MIYAGSVERPRELACDIAIYGAGPAGITLARALSGKGLRIGLFEAGGLLPAPMGPDHAYAGANAGLPYDLAGTRLRFLGGTSNHWAGWCRPLDAYDFTRRENIPLSGWPISRSELDPYLESAAEVCEVPSGGLGLAAFEHDFGYEGFLHHAVPELTVKNFLFSPPTRFGERYRPDLEASEDIHCWLDATLVRLTAAGDAIDQASILSSSGIRTRVSAQRHVLAAGAIENARVLLHSGIANSSDFVGRCFGDHLGKTIGIALADLDNRYLRHAVAYGGARFQVLPHLSFADEVLRKNDLANFGVLMDRNDRRSLAAPGAAVKTQLDRWTSGSVQKFRVLLRMENTPNPDSRITLGNATDGYGVPRVNLNWQINPFDLESVERICGMLGPLFGGTGSRLRVDFDLAAARERPGTYQAHHLGTTRMSADPQLGVVDADSRCHDIGNLYVAGSSVFPTFGFANPTLTLVALCLRLARHLADTLGDTRG